ncbi:MAG: phosphatase PAP2 family protein [Betaproteobacteria bacterium]|nr:phosphatase PAP2 family protein [Betaproteobacteria bacterium]
MIQRLADRLNEMSHWEGLVCERFNRISHYRWVRRLFRSASRLGNGVFWYALMAALLVWDGAAAVRPVLHMIAVGIVGTLLYKWLKARTSRPRPFEQNRRLLISTHPLDEFSFPSGHTLHAVAFSIVVLAYYPGLAWLVLPFSALVSLSRLVLGLHYPSDVLAGAFVGTLVATASFLPFYF